ncbi:MAG TPA: DCC1-like thiol-disulfide oxidoreductase family protein [Drouetiella sp.]
MAVLTEPKIGAHIFFYDGVCGLCNRLVNFVLPKDPEGKFQFASLQSDFAHKILGQYNIDPDDMNSFYVVPDFGLPTQRVLARSDGAAFVLDQLGGIWKIVALFKVIPKSIRDYFYGVVAEHRYKIFGKSETCKLPTPDEQRRFIEV